MTVCNANYSSVEEAYEFLNPNLQNKSNQKPSKKPCDSYNTDFDIASYTNQYVERPTTGTNTMDTAGMFNKTNFQHQNQLHRELQNPKTFQEGTPRPKQIYELEEDEAIIRQEYPNNRPDDFERSYDFQPSMIHQKKCPDMEVHIENINTNDNSNSSAPPRYDYDEDTILKMLSKKYMNEFTTIPKQTTVPPNYIDLILYIVSGVILIFIMEQFVKIGTYLG